MTENTQDVSTDERVNTRTFSKMGGCDFLLVALVGAPIDGSNFVAHAGCLAQGVEESPRRQFHFICLRAMDREELSWSPAGRCRSSSGTVGRTVSGQGTSRWK